MKKVKSIRLDEKLINDIKKRGDFSNFVEVAIMKDLYGDLKRAKEIEKHKLIIENKMQELKKLEDKVSEIRSILNQIRYL